MEGTKDILSEECKSCWRCGFKFSSGSICPMCGAVNKLAVSFSMEKDVLGGDLRHYDKPTNVTNAKAISDSEGETSSQSDAMRVFDARYLNDKRLGILPAEAQSLSPASVGLPEGHDTIHPGDYVHQQMVMGPDEGPADVTNFQMDPSWIK